MKESDQWKQKKYKDLRRKEKNLNNCLLSVKPTIKKKNNLRRHGNYFLKGCYKKRTRELKVIFRN